MIGEHINLAGQLYRMRVSESAVSMLAKLVDVQDMQAVIDGAWYCFNWTLSHTRRPIDRQKATELIPGNPYPFVIREGRDRFMLLSTHAELVTAFLAENGLDQKLDKPRIAVGKLVSDLVSPECAEGSQSGASYRLGTVFATLDGYGRALRTMAFWGDDIGNATLFHDLLKELAVYRITLRDLRKEVEIASIGSNGEVSFYFGGVGHMNRVDDLFRYMKNKYILWP